MARLSCAGLSIGEVELAGLEPATSWVRFSENLRRPSPSLAVCANRPAQSHGGSPRVAPRRRRYLTTRRFGRGPDPRQTMTKPCVELVAIAHVQLGQRLGILPFTADEVRAGRTHSLKLRVLQSRGPAATETGRRRGAYSQRSDDRSRRTPPRPRNLVRAFPRAKSASAPTPDGAPGRHPWRSASGNIVASAPVAAVAYWRGRELGRP